MRAWAFVLCVMGVSLGATIARSDWQSSVILGLLCVIWFVFGPDVLRP